MPRLSLKALTATAVLCLASFAFSAEPVADFTLQSHDGKSFKLSEQKGKYVALHFLLKTECPICIKHTREVSQRADELAGVTQVFIKPDAPDDIAKWAGQLGEGAPTIFRDPDAALAKTLAIPDGYEFHGEVVHFPALVLLDGTGQEVFRYVGKNNSDRYAFNSLKKKVADLSGGAELSHANAKAGEAAIGGYDPVAYFGAGGPTKGAADLTSEYKGVTYQFASAPNRAKFAADPAKYAPAYGGWCATAMVTGEKVAINPKNYKVTGGRLYLFYKTFLADAKPDWVKDEPGNVTKADGHWKSTVGGK